MAEIKVKTWTGTITINSEEQIGKDVIDIYLDNMPERLFLQLHYGSKITTSAIYGQTIQNETSVSLSPYGESVPASIKLTKKKNNVFEYSFSTANDVDKVDCYLLYASYNNITGVNSKYRTTNCFDIKGTHYHNTDVYLDKYIATLMFIDNTWSTYPNSTNKTINFDNWNGLNKFSDWIVGLWNKITNRNDLNYAQVRGYCYNDHLYINPNYSDSSIIFHELGHMSYWKGIKYESLKDLYQDILTRITLINSNYLFGDYKNLNEKQKKDICLIELPSEYMEYKRHWLNKSFKELFVDKKVKPSDWLCYTVLCQENRKNNLGKFKDIYKLMGYKDTDLQPLRYKENRYYVSRDNQRTKEYSCTNNDYYCTFNLIPDNNYIYNKPIFDINLLPEDYFNWCESLAESEELKDYYCRHTTRFICGKINNYRIIDKNSDVIELVTVDTQTVKERKFLPDIKKLNFSNFVKGAIEKYKNNEELSIKEKNIIAILYSLAITNGYWKFPEFIEYTLLPRVLLNSIEYDYSDQQVMNAINKAQTYDELFISDSILFNTN